MKLMVSSIHNLFNKYLLFTATINTFEAEHLSCRPCTLDNAIQNLSCNKSGKTQTLVIRSFHESKQDINANTVSCGFINKRRCYWPWRLKILYMCRRKWKFKIKFVIKNIKYLY